MTMSSLRIAALACMSIGLVGIADVRASVPTTKPVSLEAVAGLKDIEWRTPTTFSPDGQWVAFTYQTAPGVRDAINSNRYSTTGVGIAEGPGRRHIQLIDVKNGEIAELTHAGGSNWGGSWSPDGKQLAFYSDRSGEVGIWLWAVADRSLQRVGNVVARPMFGHERLRWSSDGRKLLAKVLIEGMTVAEANSKEAPKEYGRPFPPPSETKPSVVVLKSGSKEDAARSEQVGFKSYADLALIDVASGEVRRLVKGRYIAAYLFAPGSQQIAYTAFVGSVPNSMRGIAELRVISLATGEDRVLEPRALMEYGNEFSWSPDGKRVAFMNNDENNKRSFRVRALDGSKMDSPTVLGEAGANDDVPLWDAKGQTLHAIGDDALWRIDARSGKGARIEGLKNVLVRRLVARDDANVVWERNGELLAFGRNAKTNESMVLTIARASGRHAIAYASGEQSTNAFVHDVSRDGLVTYFGSDPKHLTNVWVYDVNSKQTRQLSDLNPELDRAGGGEAKRITFKSLRGEDLEGALLLPPGYQAGKRLPTLVWVYAGERVGRMLNRFGLGMTLPAFNPQVLTTRGYAVFQPDIPVRTGELMEDIHAAVMPAVDAIIEQGYADANRLAIAGHSFGSYTTYSMLVQTDRFKAAITSAHLDPNFLSAYLKMSPSSGEPSWIGYIEKGQGGMGGDPWTYPERYQKNSPVYRFDRVKTPWLMGQGSEDGDVPGADAVYVALKRLGKEVEYRVYEGEGHVISSPVHVIDWWQRRLEFLREHLGPEGVAP